MEKKLWKEERDKAQEEVLDIDLRIYASDIDPNAIAAASENAKKAGVDHVIEFSVKDVKNIASDDKNGVIITNPPYGERIGDRESISRVYKGIGDFLRNRPSWSLFIISSDKELETKLMGRPANRRRKLYNGRIETTFYQYHGERE